MKSELVSVIVPIYNVEKYLSRCIASLLEQTYKNLEIILINDGSTDNSGFICKQYLEQDDRIVYIEQLNKGLSGARNTGIDVAKGEYLLFLDSDDFIDLNFIEVLYENLILHDADFSVGGILFESETGKCLKVEKDDCVLVGDEIASYMTCSGNVLLTVAWGRLYKKYLFENVRYPEGKLNEDEYLALGLCCSANRVVISSKASSHYIQRRSSIMHRKFEVRKFEVMKVFTDRLEYFEKKGMKREYIYTLDRMRSSLSLIYVQIRDAGLHKKSDEYVEFMRWYNELKHLYGEHRKWVNDAKVIIKMGAFGINPKLNTVYLLRLVGKM